MKMIKFWKKESDNLLGSPSETMGFSKENNPLQVSSIVQNYLIKKYEFNTIEQIKNIKSQLLKSKILIINTKGILGNKKISIEEVKNAMEEIQSFLKEIGGSIGRIGDEYLILTPNPHVKISN